ncbi:Protein suppressor of sable isoform X1 [Oopsacas minuta]|uniref:Protein suppressor of sable isoform X1 n=1 Tax=Oopsacas minuta TaxID=111878 RepID=A0AAV7KGX5_9METZ|nr:Protein suppressor of sable isoform X1 [Oopsacas minuta]
MSQCNNSPNGDYTRPENAMSDGEISSETEQINIENMQNLSVMKEGEINVVKTSEDFFDSSGGDRSEGEVSDPELDPSTKPISHKPTDVDNNPWTQAAMGNYPSLPISRESGEDWRGDNVEVWNEYYTQALEHAKLNRRKKGRGKDIKRSPREMLGKSRKRKNQGKPYPPQVKTETNQLMESDESSDFDFEEKEPRMSLSDVIAQNNHIDLAVFAAENPDSMRGKKVKHFLQGPLKKKKKKKRYLKSNHIRHESRQEYWSQDKFRSTVMQPQYCIDTTVCMYWKMYGYCNKGDACGYSHLAQLKGVAPPTKRIPDVCKFYLQDSCQKGSNCNYYHEDFPCKYFHVGLTCYQGQNCKFSHAPLNEDTSKLLDKAWQTKPWTTSSTNLREDQPSENQFPALYSAVPQKEQTPPPPNFSLSSPSPMRFPHPQVDPSVPPHRYPFPPTQGPLFEPQNRPLMMPPQQLPYRPHPQIHINPRFAPLQFPSGSIPNRFPIQPFPINPLVTNIDPSPPSYQPISYESDDPGQPPVSPLSFLSDDIEDKVLMIDAGPVNSDRETEAPPALLSPKHPNIDLLFQTTSPTSPILSRSDSGQSDPRLSKGSRSKRGSLSDPPDSFSRPVSVESIRSPDLFSDTPPLLSPEPKLISPVDIKPKPEDLKFEMPLPLRDPATLTKLLDPRILFQNAIEKARKQDKS